MSRWVNITPLRAGMLYRHGEQIIRGKIESLITDAQRDMPGWVPIIVARKEEILTELQRIISEWQAGTNIPTLPGTDISLRDVEDGEAAYKHFIEELVLKAYAELRVDVYTRRPPPVDLFIPTNWFVQNEISRRRTEYEAFAQLFGVVWAQQSIINRLFEEFADYLRGMVGAQLPSFSVWNTQVERRFNSLKLKLREETQLIQETASTELPSDFIRLEQLARHAPLHSRAGVVFQELGLTCFQLKSELQVLDKLRHEIPFDEQSWARFEKVWNVFNTNHRLLCFAPLEPISAYPYHQYVRLTTTRIQHFQNVLMESWNVNVDVEKLTRQALDKGILPALELRLKEDLATLRSEIETWAEDSWKGPLTRDAHGQVLPLAGVPIGLEAYHAWIKARVQETYHKLRHWLDAQEPQIETAFFVPNEAFIAATLSEHKEQFYADPRIVILSSPRLKISVIEYGWKKFEAFAQAQAGRTFMSIESFDLLLDQQRENITAQTSQLAEIVESQGIEQSQIPEEFLTIEIHVRDKLRDQTCETIRIMLKTLQLLNSQIPWDRAIRQRYEEVYTAVLQYLNTHCGGDRFAVTVSQTAEFVSEQRSRFDELTMQDQSLARLVGSSAEFTSQRGQFVRNLEARHNNLIKLPPMSWLELEQHRGRILNDLMLNYWQWRSTIIEKAQQVLVNLASQIESHIKANESVPMELRSKVQRFQHLAFPEFSAGLERIKLLMQQAVIGGATVSILEPFAKFEPMRSKDGAHVKTFSKNDMQEVFNEWATPERLAQGVAIEPKIDGYRGTIQVKSGKVRIYMEGQTRDFSETYPSVTKDVADLPDVILDVELTEIIQGEVTPRVDMAKFRRVDVDDSHLVVLVFNILYYKDEDLINTKTYRECRKILDQFFTEHTFKHLKKLDLWEVRSITEFLKEAHRADQVAGSEGAMCKMLDVVYPLTQRRTTDWYKIKKAADIIVRVLSVHKTKADDWVYEGGVIYKDEPGIDPNEIIELDNVRYISLGRTFRTKLKVKKGDKLEVTVTEVLEQDGPQGKIYGWMLPLVKDKTDKQVFTLKQAVQVGTRLAATIDMPWKRITDLHNQLLVAPTLSEVRSIKEDLWWLVANLNYMRVRRYAFAVLALARERLGQAPDPRIGTEGVEKLWEVEVDPFVTFGMVFELRSRFRGLRESVDLTPEQLGIQVGELARMAREMSKIATGSVLALLTQLLAELEEYILEMGVGRLSYLEITSQLAELELLVRNATRLRLRTAMDRRDDIETLHQAQVKLEELVLAAAGLAKHFEDRFTALREDIEVGLAWLGWGAATLGLRIDLGCGNNKKEGYIGLDKKTGPGVDVVWDLEHGLPYANDSVAEIRAFHILEHLSNPVQIMTEIWRVLKHNGVLYFEVPSTTGKGAFSNPTHKSYWNDLSFAFYSDDQLRDTHSITCKFDIISIEEKHDPVTGVKAIQGRLRALKGGSQISATATPGIKFLGTKGFVKKDYPKHKYHSSLLLTATDGSRLQIDKGADYKTDKITPDFYLVTHAHPDHIGGFTDETVWGSKDVAKETSLDIQKFTDRKEFELGPFRIIPVPVLHSILYPAVAFRIKFDGLTLFYAPDVASISKKDRDTFLQNTDIYIGDGSNFGGFIRRKDDTIIGHADWMRQAAWCQDAGVKLFILTQFGTNYLEASESQKTEWKEQIESKYDVDIEYAEDGLVLPLQKVHRKLASAKPLTMEGEGTGEERTDYMQQKPDTIPVTGKLWLHFKGINPANKALGKDDLLKLSLSADRLNLHYDMRFNWTTNYLEGITIFLGNQTDATKLEQLKESDKLGADLKLRQPVIWNDKSQLDSRIFPPQTPGNIAALDTFGKMFYIDTVKLLPSRLRSEPIGRRYFEFYLKSDAEFLNGLWSLTEKAGEKVELPFLLSKLKTQVPFWLRAASRHKDEIEKMPLWQKPSIETIEKFLEVKIKQEGD